MHVCGGGQRKNLWRLKDGIRVPAAGVTGGYELSNVGDGNWAQASEKAEGPAQSWASSPAPAKLF